MLQDGKILLTIGRIPFFFLGNIWLDDGNLKWERLVKAGNSGMAASQQEKLKGCYPDWKSGNKVPDWYR